VPAGVNGGKRKEESHVYSKRKGLVSLREKKRSWIAFCSGFNKGMDFVSREKKRVTHPGSREKKGGVSGFWFGEEKKSNS